MRNEENNIMLCYLLLYEHINDLDCSEEDFWSIFTLFSCLSLVATRAAWVECKTYHSDFPVPNSRLIIVTT